jgi:hypothetical protein
VPRGRRNALANVKLISAAILFGAALVLGGCSEEGTTETKTPSPNVSSSIGAPDISREAQIYKEAMEKAENAPKRQPGQSPNTGAMEGAIYEQNTRNQINQQEQHRQTKNEARRAENNAWSAVNTPSGGGFSTP